MSHVLSVSLSLSLSLSADPGCGSPSASRPPPVEKQKRPSLRRSLASCLLQTFSLPPILVVCYCCVSPSCPCDAMLNIPAPFHLFYDSGPVPSGVTMCPLSFLILPPFVSLPPPDLSSPNSSRRSHPSHPPPPAGMLLFCT